MNSERITEAWKQKYNLAKIYYEHYGDIEIPKDFKTLNGYEYDENGICLGRWILAQRNAYNKINTCVINQRQIELLNMLKMRWNCLSPTDKWNKRYNLAKKYYNYYGNLEIPKSFKTLNGYVYDESGYRLGTWLIAQKEAYNDNEKNIFTPKQIELLNQIGIVWDNVRPVQTWMESYNLAKKYYEHYQNLHILKKFKTLNGYDYAEDGFKLGVWITTQRQYYKGVGGKLTSEQIELLNQIGMIWERMDIWLKKYELAKKYYEYHGNLEIPRKFKTLNGYTYDKKGVNLGVWLVVQRQYYQDIECKLTSEQINLLNQIGIRWYNIRTNLPWMESYNLAKKYYEHYQNLNIPKAFKTTNGYEYNQDGMNLGIWLANQRKLHKAANKSEIWKQQIELLNQIHMDWKADDGEMNWMKHYALAKIYYEHYGNSNIPSTFKTLNGYEFCEEGFFLGKWLSNQRQSYKGIGTFGITEEKIRRLEEIKIRWFTENCDLKLQKEDVNQNNKNQKQIEILNRVRSFLVQYDSEQLPSKEEVNQKFLNELDKNLVKRK